jgi:hypothetical protein
MEDQDSILLEIPTEKYDESKEPRLKTSNMKLLVALFIIFMIVVSDLFTNNIISLFGDKAVSGRNLTAWGTTLQGIFLVLFYIIALYLTEKEIL